MPSALGGATIASASKSLAQRTRLELVGRILDPAVLFLLLEVGFLVGRAAITDALLHHPRSVGPEVAVLAVGPLVVRLGAEVDLLLVAMIAEEQHLAAVGDQDQRVVGKGHGDGSS